MKSKLSLFSAGVALLVLATGALRPVPLLAQTDLDAFMKKVLARRDDNWKRLQQCSILTQKDAIEVRGPGQLPVWGEKRDYNWFLRDGFFVRSPLSVNGVTISESERTKYENTYLKREKERDRRSKMRVDNPAKAPAEPTPAADVPASLDSLIAQTRDPEFVSSSYFLKFKFEEGKDALVGKEKLDGAEVLKVEYYPARLFSSDIDRNKGRVERGEAVNKDRQMSAAIETAANKVSKVTLWVEPKSTQIVKYVFDNVNLDFLPAAQFVRLNDVKATMQMGQPFLGVPSSTSNPTPDVWLPKNVNMFISMMVAIGQFDMRVSMDYTEYKLAETSSRIK